MRHIDGAEGAGRVVASFDPTHDPRPLAKTTEQGAATTVWAAIGKELESRGGFYLDDVQVARPFKEGDGILDHGYASWAYDVDLASRLREDSKRMVEKYLV
jgi:hypothetical protein